LLRLAPASSANRGVANRGVANRGVANCGVANCGVANCGVANCEAVKSDAAHTLQFHAGNRSLKKAWLGTKIVCFFPPVVKAKARRLAMGREINVLALVKGEEKYVFLFDDSRRAETLRMLGRFAADPELSFSWYDAAVLGQKIRQTLPPSDAATIEAMSAAIAPASATNRSRRFDLPTS
jgi:hypothetical protein